jgi:hypothetical protein
MIDQIPLEGVQIPSRNIHARCISGDVQSTKLKAQLLRVRGLNARLASREEELLQSSVPE